MYYIFEGFVVAGTTMDSMTEMVVQIFSVLIIARRAKKCFLMLDGLGFDI